MVLLNDSVISKKMDTRLMERNVARGVVTTDEVTEFLKQLPDEAENADWVSIDSLSDLQEESSSVEH